MSSPHHPVALRYSAWALTALGLALVWPLAAILASWFALDATGLQTLQAMAQTVMPRYLLASVWLCLAVGFGVAVVGSAMALAVTVFDFPGRRFFEWALLLPLAIPPYVVAYGYTDFLQFAGPMQTAMRAFLGVQGRVFPEIRNMAGAIWVFTFTLYPYVYLLARTALSERAVSLIEYASFSMG